MFDVRRMDVCYFPTNHYVSITQDGKFNTFTAKVDETKEISSYILDTAKDFLSQNETHVGVPPNLVFDPPAILKMRVRVKLYLTHSPSSMFFCTG